MKIFLYNTKNNNGINSDKNLLTSFKRNVAEKVINSRGKIIACFELNKIAEYINGSQIYKSGIIGDYKNYERVLVPAYIAEEQLFEYSEDLAFYAIDINNLEAFEETIGLCDIRPYAPPKTMTEFLYPKTYTFKAPQSMCRARYKGEEIVVMSNQPYYNALILSGAKTCDLRKYILDCMKEYIE